MSHHSAVAPTSRPGAAPFLLGVGLSGRLGETETLPALLEATEAVRDDAGEPAQVVLLVRSAPTGRPLARAREVRSLARHHALAIIDLDLPATAADAVHTAALAVAPRVHPDLLPVLVERLAAQVRTVAVLDSVARLGSPSPKLAQHVRSWFPGSCFVVGPDPTVASGRQALLAWQAAMMAAAGAIDDPVAYDREGRSDYVELLPSRTRRLVPAEPLAGDRWGAARFLEVSWLDDDPVRIARRLDDESWSACRNCGRRTTRPVCPFCSAVTQAATGPREGDDA